MNTISFFGITPLAALAAFTAFADSPVYDKTTGFATCVTTTAGAAGTSSTWSNAADWQDENTPASTNYYVGAEYTVKGGPFADNKSTTTFSNSLYVAGQINSAGNTGNGQTFTDLHMLPGSKVYNSNIPTWRGTMWIETPEGSDPVTFSHNRDGTYYFKLSMTVKGDANARIVMSGSTANCSMSRGGDWSQFHGRFTVRDGYTITSGNVFTLPGTLEFGGGCTYNQKSGTTDSFGSLVFVDDATVNCYQLTVSGRFATGENGAVTLSGSSSFGTFSLGAGTTVTFAGTVPTITVTEGLELGSGVTFVYPAAKADMLREDPFLPVAYLSPECVEAGLPELSGCSVVVNGFPQYVPLDCHLVYRDDPDVTGGKILGIAFARVIWNTVEGPQGESAVSDHAACHKFQDSEVAEAAWSDGLSPHEGAIYYSSVKLCVCTKCKLPELLVVDDASMYVAGGCNFNELVLTGGTVYNREDTATLNGRIALAAGSRTFQTYRNRTLTINADLRGEGDIVFLAYYPNSTNISKFRLNGDNSQWSGGFKFSKKLDTGSTFAESEEMHVKIYANSSNSLGGGTTAFDYDKIQINNYGEIVVTNTSTFANANRGVYVNGNGAISVDAGQVAAFAAPFTLDGVLRKNGAGTLVLGGGVRYGLNDDLEDATAPTAEKNVILVNEGAIAGTVAGAAITFADGAGVAANAAAATDLSGSTVTADGELTVALDGEFVNETVYPVLRLTTAQATALGASIRVIKPSSARGCNMFFTGAIDGADTVYSVRFVKRGIAIMIK